MSSKIKSTIGYTVLLLAVFCLSYGGKYLWYVYTDQAPSPQAYLHHYIHEKPYIDGPPEFEQDIKNALTTIKNVSLEQYQDICKHCIEVRYIDIAYEKISASTNKSRIIKIYAKGYEQANTQKNSLERSLVHETEHLVQCAQKRDKIPIEQREAEALAAERKLLTALEFPPEIINQLAGDHRLEKRWWEQDKDILNAKGSN